MSNWLPAPDHGIFGLSFSCLCQCHYVVCSLLSDSLYLCVFSKMISSVLSFHKLCMSLCMLDMFLRDGLNHSCHRLVPLGPCCSVVCLSISDFPVDMWEWPQNVFPLRWCLLAHTHKHAPLAFPSSLCSNASVGVDTSTSSVTLFSNLLSLN